MTHIRVIRVMTTVTRVIASYPSRAPASTAKVVYPGLLLTVRCWSKRRQRREPGPRLTSRLESPHHCRHEAAGRWAAESVFDQSRLGRQRRIPSSLTSRCESHERDCGFDIRHGEATRTTGDVTGEDGA